MPLLVFSKPVRPSDHPCRLAKREVETKTDRAAINGCSRRHFQVIHIEEQTKAAPANLTPADINAIKDVDKVVYVLNYLERF